MTGKLFVVGLGPGSPDMLTPQAADALARAEDIVGYGPYVERIPERPHQRRHTSDNREELARARHALDLAARGRTVAVVSSGDPGVFAMASAVLEAMDSGEPRWRAVAVEVVPGVSAMLAAAARLGAPLGNDFCVISLSDNLKPWEVVSGRLLAAARAGFVIAIYNPLSRARPWQLGAAFAGLREVLAPETPVVFAKAVSRDDEEIAIVDLAHADASMADMRTLVLIGTRTTRRIERPGARQWLYTARWVEKDSG
jgi:precorrin-3B C17-methyltransferase